jgi:hypothetical protein
MPQSIIARQSSYSPPPVKDTLLGDRSEGGTFGQDGLYLEDRVVGVARYRRDAGFGR